MQEEMLKADKMGDSAAHNSDGPNLRLMTSSRVQVVPGQRDSGCGTDYSPASVSSLPRRFTFSDSCNIFEGIDDFTLYEVFSEDGETSKEVLNKDVDSDHDTDKEIEELLNENGETSHAVSQPISIQRPPAPVPTPDPISQHLHLICWNKTDQRRNIFRPIVSRSCGTQTPSPHSQTIFQSRSARTVRSNMHGSTRSRTRVQSESNDGEVTSTIPDVIQFPRDRCISLPDFPAFRRQQQEQEVGRELRRISDEFNSSFTRLNLSRTNRHAFSFPLRMSIDISACINGIRRILSSSPVSWTSAFPRRLTNENRNFDPSTFD